MEDSKVKPKPELKRAPPIPTQPCVYCGFMTNEVQYVDGIAHYTCFKLKINEVSND